MEINDILPLKAAHFEDRNRNERLQRVGKNSSPIFRHLWTKVHEILGAASTFVVSNAIPRVSALHHVSFQRYSPLGVRVDQRYTALGPQLFREGQSQFLWQFVGAICLLPFADLHLTCT